LFAIDTAGKASVDDTAGGLGGRGAGASTGGRAAPLAALLEAPHTLFTGAGCAHAKGHINRGVVYGVQDLCGRQWHCRTVLAAYQSLPGSAQAAQHDCRHGADRKC